MTRNLLGRRSPSEEMVDEFKVAQKYSSKKISPDDLPFDLTGEFGAVLQAELIAPGIYFLIVGVEPEQSEIYAVTEDAPAISKKARGYGREVPDHPGLRTYKLYQEGSGWCQRQ